MRFKVDRSTQRSNALLIKFNQVHGKFTIFIKQLSKVAQRYVFVLTIFLSTFKAENGQVGIYVPSYKMKGVLEFFSPMEVPFQVQTFPCCLKMPLTVQCNIVFKQYLLLLKAQLHEGLVVSEVFLNLKSSPCLKAVFFFQKF